MESKVIAFIGGGNMANSIIGGLVASEFPAKQIWVSDPSEQQLERLRLAHGVNTTKKSSEAIAQADVVVFSVKPQVLTMVFSEVSDSIKQRNPLVLSIIAGAKVESFERALGKNLAIVRTMPNTPALLGCGATGLYANEAVSEQQKALAENIMRSVGVVVWFEQEEKLNAVTAVAGSGPAYFFLVMEAMQEAAEAIGLNYSEAKLLVRQTALGSARMAFESQDDVAELRRKVTSPGGTTERAINCLQQAQLVDTFKRAIAAADERAEELSNLIME